MSAILETPLTQVRCSDCDRPISSIPNWLSGAKVNFQCEECRQRHPRPLGPESIEPLRKTEAKAEEADEVGPMDDSEAVVEEEPAEELEE
jgi:hypothetical protein